MDFRGKSVPIWAAIILVGVWSCGKKTQETLSMLVVFSSGEVHLTRAAAQLPVKAGMLVNAGDIIQTKEGSVDLQTRAGTAVRVRSNSRIAVDEIAGPSGGANKVALSQGSVFANAKKQAASEEFSIRTPTAIAGVRGTSFSVTVDEKGHAPQVRVLDGKVAFAPRSSKADQSAKLPEVVVEGNKSVQLPPGVESKLAAGQEIQADAIKANSFRPTAEERLDKATLVVVTPTDFDTLKAGKKSGALEELALTRDQEQEKMLLALRRENAVQGLDNREELRQYYSKVVSVRMKDGRSYKGAVISRSASKIVIHTDTSGILTLNSGDVEAVQ